MLRVISLSRRAAVVICRNSTGGCSIVTSSLLRSVPIKDPNRETEKTPQWRSLFLSHDIKSSALKKTGLNQQWQKKPSVPKEFGLKESNIFVPDLHWSLPIAIYWLDKMVKHTNM